MGEPEIKIIDVFICKLRKWLSNASGGKEYIETVWAAATISRSRAKGCLLVEITTRPVDCWDARVRRRLNL
jgi:two-component system, cell cycle response regulator CtrA